MKIVILAIVAAAAVTTAAVAQDAASFGAPPAIYPACTKPHQDRCRVVMPHAAKASHRAVVASAK